MKGKGSRITVTVLSILMIVAFALPAQSHAEGQSERVMIEFVPGQRALVESSLAKDGAEIHYVFDDLNVMAVTLPSQSITSIADNPNVVHVEPDVLRYPTDQVVPYGVDSVEARDVWDANRDGVIDPGAPTGAGRTVCIIDSGIAINHEDFAGINFVGGYPTGWDTDNYGHGTHVAGIVAAMNNSTGVLGVTPGDVSLYIVKVWGDNGEWVYSSTLIDAANRCRNAGAQIITMSLAGTSFSNYENTNFQNLYNQGVLLVAAAGNGGGTAYAYPASYDSVISVGAVDQNDVVASFSRRNDKVELTAPGVGVLSTWKDGGYAYMSGTSMAAPHVAAAAAVVWSSDPSKTNAEIRAALQQTALDLGTPGRDNAYGYGVVQAADAIDLLNPAPTAVKLTRFGAKAVRRGVRIEWETASEINNLGFNLYRAESLDGLRVQVNSSFIPSLAPGSPLGASYSLLDQNVQPNTTYYYWLEDVNLQGVTTLHGPVTVTTKAGASITPTQP
jgi:subtilisin family serine protease